MPPQCSTRDYRLLARLYPLINTDKRVAKYRDGFGLFGSVYTTLFKKSSDEERKERLAELGPMVLEIINAHVHSFSVVASQEEPLVLDAQGIAILKELLALVRPKPATGDDQDKRPPTAAKILDHIKAALDNGVDPASAKYTALAERIKLLRDRIIQNAQDALEFLAEALGSPAPSWTPRSTPIKPSSCWTTTTWASCPGSSTTTHRPASPPQRGTWPRRSTRSSPTPSPAPGTTPTPATAASAAPPPRSSAGTR
ncbi:hypothetical protein [Streptomyces sp. NPDC050388]|uniref:hypothetical protein n=1 Tax=Streptomyces sp. NPDC050388 TaxID=3155781 RepID=UPI003439088D